MLKHVGTVLLVVGLAGGVLAESELGVYGAYWAPKDGDDAFGGGVKLGFEMVDRVQFELRTGVFGDLLDSVNGVAADLDDVALEAGLALLFPVQDRMTLYAGGGLGYHFLSGSGAAASANDELGFYGVGGMDWAVHRSGALYGETSAKLFAELLYRFVETDGLVPEGSVDIDLNGLGVQVGLLIGW